MEEETVRDAFPAGQLNSNLNWSWKKPNKSLWKGSPPWLNEEGVSVPGTERWERVIPSAQAAGCIWISGVVHHCSPWYPKPHAHQSPFLLGCAPPPARTQITWLFLERENTTPPEIGLFIALLFVFLNVSVLLFEKNLLKFSKLLHGNRWKTKISPKEIFFSTPL